MKNVFSLVFSTSVRSTEMPVNEDNWGLAPPGTLVKITDLRQRKNGEGQVLIEVLHGPYKGLVCLSQLHWIEDPHPLMSLALVMEE